MTTDQVYQIILYATAKNKSQGYVSPDDFNNVFTPQSDNNQSPQRLSEDMNKLRKYFPNL